MKKGEWKTVVSSNINKVKHDQETNTLFIEFYNEAQYSYTPITKETYNNLLEAESVGKFFNKHIRNNDAIEEARVN